ncbi:hypothetical protein [Streptococcus suis]|uniref:hypothetical protein n=1 Tax=Streptococcus suis TaxID=1307 RepID=UPI0020167C03
MMTEHQSNWLATQVYSVDGQKNDGQYETISKGTYYYDKNNPEIGQFQVLAVEDNTVNGMQAMAVAPVVNGLVDYDNVTIAYAGTNFGEREVINENMAKMASRYSS